MNKADELRVQNEKLSEDIWQKTLAERQANFDKAGKHDKIEPLQTIPIYQFEERQKKDPDYVKNLKEQGYLITTDKENGKVNLYPKTEIESRIIKNGLRTDEIVNKLGVGDKDLIDTEFGEIIKNADEYHSWQTKNTLQDLMVEKGWSKDKAIDYLVNVKKLGTKEGLEKLYNTDFKEIDKNVRSWYAYGEDYQPSYLDKDGNMVNDASLIGKWKDNDIITLARDRRFIDSYGANITQTSPNPGNDEYGAQVLQRLRSGKWGWNPKTNSLIKLGADDAYKDLAIDPTEEDVNEISRIGDYRKLTNQQFNDKYYAPQSKIEKDWQKGKVPVQISANENYMATELGQDENGNTVDYQFGIEVPTGTDPNTGEIITKRVPVGELTGKTVYMTEEEADRYRRARVKSNMGAVSRNPLWYAPALIGAAPGALPFLNAAMNFAPVASLPWLNAGNLLTADMAYNALRPDGDFSQAGKAWDKGNYTEALGHGFWGALGVAPLFKPAIGTARAFNTLRTRNGLGVLPTKGNYTALYKTPLNSGLVVGNTNLQTAEPAFTSFTDPLNKFLDRSSKILGKNSFGELKLMKQSPSVTGAAGVRQNLLGSGNLVSQSLRRSAQTLDTEIPLYRIEPKNFVQSNDPLDKQFMDHISDDIADFRDSKNIVPFKNEGAHYNSFWGPEGTQLYSRSFPAHTHGNWWTSVEPTVKGAPSIGAPGSFNVNDINKLTTKVPFSALDKYHVSKDPMAMEFAGRGTDEYILPSKFRENIKVEDWNKPSSTDIAGTEQAAGTVTKEPLTQNGAISLIEDARTEQLGKWQTKEGRKRLSKWIAENPHMKGLKPEDMIKGLEDLKNLNLENQNILQANATRMSDINKEVAEVDLMLETGAIDEQQHVSMVMKLEDERNLLEGESDYIIMQGDNYASNGKLGREVPRTSKPGSTDLVKGEERDATYNILLGLNFTPEEAYVLSRHELQGHYTQRGKKTKMDAELGGLDLKESAVKPGEGTLFGETNTAQAGQDDWLGRNKDFGTYFERAKEYFLNGSKGQEKTAFAAEVRADMLRTGAIKDLYDPITARALKAYYDAYSAGGHEVPLRLFDIMEGSNKNFKKLSGLLNRLPVIAGALAVGEAMWDEDTKGEQKAGLGILAAGLLGRGRNLKGLAKFVNNLGNAFKVGKIRSAEYEALALANDTNKGVEPLNNEAIKLANDYFLTEAKARKYKQRGVADKNDPLNLGIDKLDVALKQHPGSHASKRAKAKSSFWTSDDVKRVADETTAKRLQLNDKGEIESLSTNRFTSTTSGDPTIKTGSTSVFNFKTGENVDVSVEVPGASKTFSKENGQLVVKSGNETGNPSVSQSLLTTLLDNVDEIEGIIPGAKVFGSTIGVLEGGLPHLSKDLDLMITEADYNKNVKDKFPFVQQFGPAMQHEVKAGIGEQGILDFNIIHQGADGLVKPTIPATMAYKPEYVPIEIELFRQFFPEEYAKASLESLKTYSMEPFRANDIKIPLTPEQLIAGVDPVVKTIIDAMEATKDKHLLKYDTYLSYGNPDAVTKAQEYYVRGLVGKNGSVGYQFDPSAFADEAENGSLLIQINFLGDAEAVAKDPKKMQNAINDFYINNTVFSRQILLENLTDPKTQQVDLAGALDAFKNWSPKFGGGVLNGVGLNTVQLGDPQHFTNLGNVMGHKQYNLELSGDAKSDPLSYVKEIKRQTRGDQTFGADEMKIVRDLHEKYGVDPGLAGKTMEEIISSSATYVKWDKQAEFLTELGNQLNIRSVTRPRNRYGTSLYSSGINKFNETLDGLIISFYKHAAKPKSFKQRQEKVEAIVSSTGTSRDAIRSLDDFNKFESLLTGGLAKAEKRMRELRDYQRRIEDEMRAFGERAAGKKKILFNEKNKELDKLKAQVQAASDDYTDLKALRRKAEAYRAMILVGGALLLGGIGIGSAQREKWANEDEFYQKRREKARAEGVQNKNKDKIALERKLGGATDKLHKFIR
jgi:hypothetical protein